MKQDFERNRLRKPLKPLKSWSKLGENFRFGGQTTEENCAIFLIQTPILRKFHPSRSFAHIHLQMTQNFSLFFVFCFSRINSVFPKFSSAQNWNSQVFVLTIFHQYISTTTLQYHKIRPGND